MLWPSVTFWRLSWYEILCYKLLKYNFYSLCTPAHHTLISAFFSPLFTIWQKCGWKKNLHIENFFFTHFYEKPLHESGWKKSLLKEIFFFTQIHASPEKIFHSCHKSRWKKRFLYANLFFHLVLCIFWKIFCSWHKKGWKKRFQFSNLFFT